MRGDLSLVADGLMCRQCDETIQEAENLMVDGETYGCVTRYLHKRQKGK